MGLADGHFPSDKGLLHCSHFLKKMSLQCGVFSDLQQICMAEKVLF